MSNPTGKGGFGERPEDRNINGKNAANLAQLRKLALSIGNETVTGKDGTQISRVELILRMWSMSNNWQLQKLFMEYAYGKVPDDVSLNMPQQITFRVIYADERDPDNIEAAETRPEAA
jgi:hypothetical protein